MNETILTLIRAVLKVGGGFLVAHGLADDSTVETIIAGVLAVIGIVWGIVHRNNSGSGSITGGGATTCFLLLILGAGLCTGCAHIVSTQEDVAQDGSKRTTKVSASTFFDSKNSLSKLKTTQTSKSQGFGVDSLSQESTGTNISALSGDVVRGLQIIGSQAR